MRTGDINHVPGVYISLCYGVERSVPEIPAVSRRQQIRRGGECAGQNAIWTILRRAKTR